MALHFTLMVNDEPIGVFVATRASGGVDPDDLNTYDVELHEHSTRTHRTAQVRHRYGDGAIPLIVAGLTAIKEQQ